MKKFILILVLGAGCLILNHPVFADTVYIYSDNKNVGLINGAGQGDYFPYSGGTLPTSTVIYFSSTSTVRQVCQLTNYASALPLSLTSLGGHEYSFITSSSTDVWGSLPLAFVDTDFCLGYSSSDQYGFFESPLLDNSHSNIAINTVNVDLTATAPGPPPPTLSWYVPDGSTTTPDFPVWETNATNLSTSTIYRLDVVYSFSGGGGNGGGSWGDSYDDWFLAGTTAEWFSSHFAYTATPWGFFSTSTWAGNGPNKGISLITPFYSPPYSWSATAYLYATTTVAANLGVDNPGAAIASSTVNFSINPGTPTATDTYPGVVQPYPSSTAGCGTSTPLFETTGSPPYFQINDPIPVIQVGVCKAMGSLFQMTPAQSTDINDRLVAIQNSVALKPPFAFFNELGNTIGYFAVGTTTYSSYNPVNGTIGGELVIPTTTFVLMDASSTAGFSPLFTPIDDGLAVLIYVISLTWLLKRIRYVEL